MALTTEGGGRSLVSLDDPLVAYERELAEARRVKAPLSSPFAKPLFKSEADRRAFQEGPFMRSLRNSQLILRERCAARDAARAARDPTFAPRESDFETAPVRPLGGYESVDLYGLLGCDEHASAAEIHKAYRRQVLKYHPDKANYYRMLAASEFPIKGGGFFSELNREVDELMREAFLLIKDAYEILRDANTRRQRAAGARARRHPPGAPATPPLA